MKNSGFTLIEVLIYLALFALVIGGGMIAVYQIIDSTNKTNDKVVVLEDADFLLRKLDWALTGATGVSVSNIPFPKLTINKPTGNLIFTLESDNLKLDTFVLNSSFVKIAPVSGIDVFTNPTAKQVQIIFTVNGQRFNETKYLH